MTKDSTTEAHERINHYVFAELSKEFEIPSESISKIVDKIDLMVGDLFQDLTEIVNNEKQSFLVDPKNGRPVFNTSSK